MDKKTFAGRFLSKLEKIDPKQIELFLTKMVQERNFLNIVFNSMLEGVIVTDADLRTLLINRAAREHLGIAEHKKILGTPLLEQVQDQRLAELIADFAPAQDQAKTREITVTFPDRRIYGVSVVPVKDETGVISTVVFIINDLTARKKKERERVQAERLRSLAKLTAGLAHEIKNPLNSLTIHAQLLRKMLSLDHEGDRQIDFSRMNQSVNILLEEIQRMSKLVDQFILATRPSRPNFGMHNINSLLQQIAEFLGPELELKGIRLQLDLDSEVPLMRLDEHQMGQAMLNIVRNSIEAIGTADGQIDIKTRLRDDSIQIDVTDNGCGIPEEDQGKIFEPYFTKKFSGSGLGLMVVYRVIREHNGRIGLKSEPGQGTTFTITLPLLQKPLRLLAEKSGKRQ